MYFCNCQSIKTAMESKNCQNEESDLLLRLKSGDKEAFTTFFYIYKDKLYGFLLSLNHSPAKAEDMVQEIFMKIWQTHDKLDSGGNLNAYIFRITQNYAIDQLRKKTHEILSFSEDYIAGEEDSVTPGPADELINKELSLALTKAIAHLPPQQQKIFIYHSIEGLPHQEIARILNLSVSTIQNHMRKAFSNIRFFLSNNYPIIALFLTLSYSFVHYFFS